MTTLTQTLPGPTLGQIKKFNLLLNRLGLDRTAKDDMLYNATLGRTTSTKELSTWELDQIIGNLQKQFEDDPKQRMRRKCLSIAHELGWHLPGSIKLDYQRINSWLLKFGHQHKPLNDYTEKELPTLVSQFEGLLKTQLR